MIIILYVTSWLTSPHFSCNPYPSYHCQLCGLYSTRAPQFLLLFIICVFLSVSFFIVRIIFQSLRHICVRIINRSAPTLWTLHVFYSFWTCSFSYALFLDMILVEVEWLYRYRLYQLQCDFFAMALCHVVAVVWRWSEGEVPIWKNVLGHK